MQEPRPGPDNNETLGTANVNVERQAPAERLRQQWQHDRLAVTGPAVIAATLDRDRQKVEVVDLLMTTRESTAPMTEEVHWPADLEAIMKPEEFSSFMDWMVGQGFDDRAIHLRREMELTAPYNELVRYAPKRQLWCDPGLEIAEEDKPANGSSLRRLGIELASEPAVPERFESNGTLGGALMAMEWGEMFELPYDSTPLRTAENLTRQARLSLANRPRGYDTLDPTFIELVRNNPELTEKLRRGYRRLTQLADQVASAGGVAEYITKNYGEVYLLEWRSADHSVRLDDPRLVGSPAALEQQLDFLKRWRSVSEQFHPEEPPRLISQEVALPRPPDLSDVVDHQRLRGATEARVKCEFRLDRVEGVYGLAVPSNEPQLRAKAEEYIRIMGFGSLEDMWREDEELKDTLIRLGIHPRDPFLSRLIPTEPHQVELIISAQAEDILQASYQKPWTSCVDLEDGSHSDGLYEDIANGTVVAYLMKDGQYLARVLVRTGSVEGDPTRMAAAIERVYGDERYAHIMGWAIERVLEQADIETGKGMVTLPYSERTFFDSDTGIEAAGDGKYRHYYYTEQEQS